MLGLINLLDAIQVSNDLRITRQNQCPLELGQLEHQGLWPGIVPKVMLVDIVMPNFSIVLFRWFYIDQKNYTDKKLNKKKPFLCVNINDI